MAVRYAVATGNWSDAATWDGGTLPTSVDDVFSNSFTVTIDIDIEVQSIRNTAQSPAVAGGGFVLSGTYIVNATGSGFIAESTRLITYTGSDSVISGNIIGSTTTNVQTVYHDSTGSLTINGNVVNTANPSVDVIRTNSTGTLNINGNIQGDGRGVNVVVASVCTVHIVGNLTRGSNFSGGSSLRIDAGATVNITGNVSNNARGTGSPTIVLNSSACVLNVTGDVFNNSSQGSCESILVSQPARANVVGSVYNLQAVSPAIRSTVSSYMSIVGPIYTTVSIGSVASSSSSAINLFSGPFICASSGAFPFSVSRMHLIRTLGSYFEFRDETTNGALPPSAPAPATRLVSPDTVVDAPIPADVRDGVSYALSTFTGTLKVPSPDSVAAGVPTDNTVGNAVLTPQAVWDYATASITNENSIGARLKNCSTVDTTGEQLEALL